MHFGYCNSTESMLYYSHNKGGTVQWQSKPSASVRKDTETQSDSNEKCEGDVRIGEVNNLCKES